MSAPEPIRPVGPAWGDHAAEMAPLLREWALLRERESELLRRMAELLEPLSRGRGATDEAGDVAVETRARPGDSPGELSASPADGPGWIDRTIEAALASAFSADPEPDVAELPAVDLLLLRSGDTWVGMPWDRVTRLGLSDDAQLAPPCAPLSLREILGLGRPGDGHENAAEPYCLTWDTAGGPRSLCCEVLGGVLVASAAAAREVDLIWLPDDSESGGRLLPLVEFYASIGRDGRSDAEVLDPHLDDAERASSPPPTMAEPAFAESPPAPAPLSPITGVSHDPGADSCAAGSREMWSPRRPGSDHGGSPDGTRHVPHAPGGGYSALVSVRYLPARVAIARALRSHGWFVLEAADTEELPGMLQRVHHTVVFTEAPERPEPGWANELVRAQESGTRIIGVASRLRGTVGDPWLAFGSIPRLLYPFQEAELERLIESAAQPKRA
jgi:hypothetical protein